MNKGIRPTRLVNIDISVLPDLTERLYSYRVLHNLINSYISAKLAKLRTSINMFTTSVWNLYNDYVKHFTQKHKRTNTHKTKRSPEAPEP